MHQARVLAALVLSIAGPVIHSCSLPASAAASVETGSKACSGSKPALLYGRYGDGGCCRFGDRRWHGAGFAALSRLAAHTGGGLACAGASAKRTTMALRGGAVSDPYTARMQVMITRNMRKVLTEELDYLPEEVDDMDPQIAAVVIEKSLPRPRAGMPIVWRKSMRRKKTSPHAFASAVRATRRATRATLKGAGAVLASPLRAARVAKRTGLKGIAIFVLATAVVLAGVATSSPRGQGSEGTGASALAAAVARKLSAVRSWRPTGGGREEGSEQKREESSHVKKPRFSPANTKTARASRSPPPAAAAASTSTEERRRTSKPTQPRTWPWGSRKGQSPEVLTDPAVAPGINEDGRTNRVRRGEKEDHEPPRRRKTRSLPATGAKDKSGRFWENLDGEEYDIGEGENFETSADAGLFDAEPPERRTANAGRTGARHGRLRDTSIKTRGRNRGGEWGSEWGETDEAETCPDVAVSSDAGGAVWFEDLPPVPPAPATIGVLEANEEGVMDSHPRRRQKPLSEHIPNEEELETLESSMQASETWLDSGIHRVVGSLFGGRRDDSD